MVRRGRANSLFAKEAKLQRVTNSPETLMRRLSPLETSPDVGLRSLTAPGQPGSEGQVVETKHESAVESKTSSTEATVRPPAKLAPLPASAQAKASAQLRKGAKGAKSPMQAGAKAVLASRSFGHAAESKVAEPKVGRSRNTSRKP